MLTHIDGNPAPTSGVTLNIAMDGWDYSDGSRRLATFNVYDCLAMLMHDAAAGSGVLAHISWPVAASAKIKGTNPQKVAYHTSRLHHQMLNRLGASNSRRIEVVLWRGLGFSSSLSMADSSGNILDDLDWDHFANVYDFTEHGGTLPYANRHAITFDPRVGHVWYHD